MEKVKETITWKIRRLDRVRSTLTTIRGRRLTLVERWKNLPSHK
jgi:hypothetical protein